VIGVGKTVIAKQLANTIDGAVTLLEDFDSHPFLDDFYTDDKYTFETELNFLLIHYHQLLKAMGVQPIILISDYFFDKDRLFADANILSETEIFMKTYDYLRSRLVCPDMIICLSGTTDMIYNRVLARKRDTERNISRNYIDKINSYYKSFFAGWRKKYCVIDVDMNANDFVKDPALINLLQQKLLRQQII
jgi:deoxyadenosine/deoxycytidine kinase